MSGSRSSGLASRKLTLRKGHGESTPTTSMGEPSVAQRVWVMSPSTFSPCTVT